MQINTETTKDLALLKVQLHLASETVGQALQAARNNKPQDYENKLDEGMMLIANIIKTIYDKPAVAALISASIPKKVTTTDLKPITNASLPPDPFDKWGHLKPAMNHRRKKEIGQPPFLSHRINMVNLLK